MAAEVAYVGLLGAHPKFQKYVDAQAAKDVRESGSQQTQQALASITRDAAKILGVADRVGTLEVGKDGDVACYDGDPFEWTTHCTGTVIQGRVVSEGERN